MKENVSVKERFENEAQVWGDKYKDHKSNIIACELVRRKDILINYVLSKFGKRGIAVLEVGCGSGEVLFELSSRKELGERIGVDISPEMIEKARKHNKNENLNFFSMDFENEEWPEPNTRFDVIYMMGVVGYFESNKIVFDKVNSLLKEEGLLIFTYGNKESFFRRLRGIAKKMIRKEYHFKNYSHKEIIETLPSDLEITEVFNIGFASGFFGKISVGFSKILEGIFSKDDPLRLALSRFVVVSKKKN